MLFDIIPKPLKVAISVGIGLFIIFIVLQGAKVITAGPCLTTLVEFRKNFSTSGLCALLALTGPAITVKLYHSKVVGALLWGILITWGMGIVCQLTGSTKSILPPGCFLSIRRSASIPAGRLSGNSDRSSDNA